MKNAIILHGISSNPNQFWFPYIQNELEKKGYEVWVPQLPDPDNPQLAVQLPWVLEKGTFTKNTVIIGHSSGSSLILGILDALESPVNAAILVSGFLILGGERPDGIVKNENDYNWDKMRKNSRAIYFINSINDPWGCNDTQGRKMFDHLGGTQIVNNDGHMGSESYNQPYKEFPLLLKLVELSETR